MEGRQKTRKRKGETTYNDQHEVLEHGLEMAVPRDGDRAVNHRAHKRPDKPRHRLRPAAEDLQTQAHAVDVGAIVRNNAEGEDNEAELAEAAERRE